MARARLSALLHDLRGTVGNMVFDNYSGVHIVRSLPSYTNNPQSQHQSEVRAALSVYTTAWRGMTLTQQQDWALVAARFPTGNESDAKLNRGGIVTVPRGPFNAWNAFLACNMNRYLSGYCTVNDVLVTAPITRPLPDPLKTVSVTGIPMRITFSWEYITPGVANERLEVWIRSNDANIHPQLIYSEAKNANGSVDIELVRSRGGLWVIPPAGLYKLQAMIVNEFGLTSAPSEIVQVKIGGDDVFTYLAEPVQVENQAPGGASVARSAVDISGNVPVGAHTAILLLECGRIIAAGGVTTYLKTWRDAVQVLPDANIAHILTDVSVGHDQMLQPITTARTFEREFSLGVADTAGYAIWLIGYIS